MDPFTIGLYAAKPQKYSSRFFINVLSSSDTDLL